MNQVRNIRISDETMKKLNHLCIDLAVDKTRLTQGDVITMALEILDETCREKRRKG